MAHALDLNWVSAGEFQEVGEGRLGKEALSGQAVLSRYPIRDAAVIRFRDQARFRWRFNPLQPRRGGRIALRAHTAGIVVYDLHLESGGNDRIRRRQLAEVVEDAGTAASPPPVAPRITSRSSSPRCPPADS